MDSETLKAKELIFSWKRPLLKEACLRITSILAIVNKHGNDLIDFIDADDGKFLTRDLHIQKSLIAFNVKKVVKMITACRESAQDRLRAMGVDIEEMYANDGIEENADKKLYMSLIIKIAQHGINFIDALDDKELRHMRRSFQYDSDQHFSSIARIFTECYKHLHPREHCPQLFFGTAKDEENIQTTVFDQNTGIVRAEVERGAHFERSERPEDVHIQLPVCLKEGEEMPELTICIIGTPDCLPTHKSRDPHHFELLKPNCQNQYLVIANLTGKECKIPHMKDKNVFIYDGIGGPSEILLSLIDFLKMKIPFLKVPLPNMIGEECSLASMKSLSCIKLFVDTHGGKISKIDKMRHDLSQGYLCYGGKPTRYIHSKLMRPFLVALCMMSERFVLINGSCNGGSTFNNFSLDRDFKKCRLEKDKKSGEVSIIVENGVVHNNFVLINEAQNDNYSWARIHVGYACYLVERHFTASEGMTPESRRVSSLINFLRHGSRVGAKICPGLMVYSSDSSLERSMTFCSCPCKIEQRLADAGNIGSLMSFLEKDDSS